MSAELQALSEFGVTHLEFNMNRMNESVLYTITSPILSGRSLQVFSDNMKEWKDTGLITKWKKNRLGSKIHVYFNFAPEPYIVSITGLAIDRADIPRGRKAQKLSLAQSMTGKIKSPFRFFRSFNQEGFADIFESLLDVFEDDIDRDKSKPKGMEDEEWEELKEKIESNIVKAKKALKKMKLVEQLQNKMLSSNIDIKLDGSDFANMIKEDFDQNPAEDLKNLIIKRCF